MSVCSAVSWVKTLGSVPVSRFMDRSSAVSAVRVDHWDGSGPENELPPREMLESEGSSDQADGSVPTRPKEVRSTEEGSPPVQATPVQEVVQGLEADVHPVRDAEAQLPAVTAA